MRITKDLTYQIIEKLVSPITEKIKQNEQLLCDIASKIMIDKCPKEVIKIWNFVDKKYIRSNNSINVAYLGSYYYCYFDLSYPSKDDCINIVDIETANKFQDIVNNNIDLRAKSKKLSKELEITILKLSTYARIKEQFPEAAAFLPSEQKMEIALNIQDIRNKLKDLP